MLIPVLPTISSQLHISSFQVSLLITLFSISAGLIIPIAGILSDRFGRKWVIVPALFIYGAGGLLTGLAAIWNGGQYDWMLAGRILQGLGAAGTAPIAMALVSDLFNNDERSRVLGIIEASNGMGKVISPILGSLLALIAWYALFFLFPIFCVAIALAVWFFIHEKENREPPPLSQYGKSLSQTWKRQGGWLLVAFLAGAVTLFILFGVLFYLSNFLENRYGLTGVPKGLVLAIPLLAMSGVSYFSGSHIREKTSLMKRLIIIGLASIALGMGLVPLISNTYLLLTVLIIIGAGSGLVLPCLNILITSAVGSKERGIITSLYGSVRFLGVAMGPPTFSALAPYKWWLFLGTATLAGGTVLLCLWFLKQPEGIRGKGGQIRLYMRHSLRSSDSTTS